MRHSGAALLIAAALIAFISGSESRFLLQSSTSATCSIDPNTQLSLGEVTSACVAPSNSSNPPRTFCDACSCALFSAFAPALQAAGVTNTSDATVASKGVAIVAACINNFLAQFVSAKVDVQALVALGDCQYAAGEVPSCLPARVAALTGAVPAATTNTTTSPAPPSSPSVTQPAVNASTGPPDYQPDVQAPTDINDAINQQPTTTSPSPADVAVGATAPSTSSPTTITTVVPTVTSPAPPGQPVSTPVPAPSPTGAGFITSSSPVQIVTALLGTVLLLTFVS